MSSSPQGGPALQHKTLKLERKFVDVEARTFSGYASIFNELDLHGDVVEPGAYIDTIRDDFQAYLDKGEPSRIKVLWQHQWSTPIGLPTVMREDMKGLYVEAKISETRAGDEALTLMADGAVDGISIGYEVMEYSIFEDEALRAQLRGWARWGDLRKLIKLKLREFSPVTFPACEGARVIVAAKDATSGLWAVQFDPRSPEELQVADNPKANNDADDADGIVDGGRTAAEKMEAALSATLGPVCKQHRLATAIHDFAAAVKV